jgi:FkbM family methyltransferase
MMTTLKSKVKRLLKVLSGDFAHLKVETHIDCKWYGNSYGGFFAVPKYLNRDTVVYSFGIGEDISFDRAVIANHNCPVFGFDPTPKSIQWVKSLEDRPEQFRFLNYGVGAKSEEVTFYLPKNPEHVSGSMIQQDNVTTKDAISVQIRSLNDITKELGHNRIDVVKMDIEGAEYDVLDDILKTKIPIGQILVEFHDRFFPDGREKTRQAINNLKAHGFSIFGVSDTFEEVSFINLGYYNQ